MNSRKIASLISRGASEIDWLFGRLILGRIVMEFRDGRVYPDRCGIVGEIRLMRMQMDVPSSLESHNKWVCCKSDTDVFC